MRAVGFGRVGAVVGAVGLDRLGHLHSELDAFGLGGPVRDRLERCRVGLFDLGFLLRVDLGEDLPRGGRGRRLSRCARRKRNGRDDARVTILHRIDRVRHGDMHHRQGAQFGIVADVVGHQGIGEHVPISDDIGARGRNQQRSGDYSSSKVAAGNFKTDFIGRLPL